MDREEAVQKARAEAEEMYRTGQFPCSETVFLVANVYLGKPVPDEVVKLASGFPVDMGLAGCACGALTSGVMSLGLKYGPTHAGAPTPGMFEAAKDLRDRFRARCKSTCCRVLIRRVKESAEDSLPSSVYWSVQPARRESAFDIFLAAAFPCV